LPAFGDLNQKKALESVIATGGAASPAKPPARATWLRPCTRLEERHIIRLDTRQGATRYRLVDPFFARWLNAAQAL
jgi:hypothetical protein